MKRRSSDAGVAAMPSTRYGAVMAWTSVIFVAATIAMLALCIVTARSNVERDLGSRAQEAATGLAKLLETAMDDRVMVETVVSALFDRGHFAAVTVVSSEGRTLAYKALSSAVPGVPRWFIEIVGLDPPSSEAVVTYRWRELGRVIVASHPHFAYLALWHTVLGIVAVLLSAYIAVLMLLLRLVGVARRERGCCAAPSSHPPEPRIDIPVPAFSAAGSSSYRRASPASSARAG